MALIGKNEWRGIDNGEIKLYICGWRCRKIRRRTSRAMSEEKKDKDVIPDRQERQDELESRGSKDGAKKGLQKSAWNPIKKHTSICVMAWNSRYEHLASLNLFTFLYTAAILGAYMFICVPKDATLSQVELFIIDAMVPSVLTYAVSIIMQIFMTGFKKKNPRWSTAAPFVALIVVYAIIGVGARYNQEEPPFIAVCALTFTVFVFSLISLCQIEDDGGQKTKFLDSDKQE